jgi:1-deoxy-D-xylulose-5-phosphate reductoisomerase
MPVSPTCRIIVLGSTGSIGTQTLEVIAHLNQLHERGEFPRRFEVVGLAAGRKLGMLTEQAARFGVRHLALGDPDQDARERTPTLQRGEAAAEALVREVDCDLVVAAITGAAGLPATLAAVELGRDVALANKETLVAAGTLIVPAAQRSRARLLPIDSEHSALWQCLMAAGAPEAGVAAAERPSAPMHAPPCSAPASVVRVILTASGGPFREWALEQIERATPEEALRHPTWNMGPKVTVDCASLTNKALEVIEAHWLFDLSVERIEVVVHPQSIIHSLVEFADGSTIAQLGPPDMRAPIQFALAYPHRPPGLARRLDWRELRSLEFEPPDLDRFPALSLAYRVIRAGGTAGAIFNAANEAGVEAFLAGKLPFGRIASLAAAALDEVPVRPLRSLADAEEADATAREHVARHVAFRSA